MTDLRATNLLRDIPDFPKAGIVFKDITPVLQDPAAFREVVERMTAECREWNPTVIAGVESRGFSSYYDVPVVVLHRSEICLRNSFRLQGS
jgi:adenine phosphoribosyltransferase